VDESGVFPCRCYSNIVLHPYMPSDMNNRPVGDSSSETVLPHRHDDDHHHHHLFLTFYVAQTTLRRMTRELIINGLERMWKETFVD
jgi:hypothetical protein